MRRYFYFHTGFREELGSLATFGYSDKDVAEKSVIEFQVAD